MSKIVRHVANARAHEKLGGQGAVENFMGGVSFEGCRVWLQIPLYRRPEADK